MSEAEATPPENFLGGTPKLHGKSITEERAPTSKWPYPKAVTLMAISMKNDRLRARTIVFESSAMIGPNDVGKIEQDLLLEINKHDIGVKIDSLIHIGFDGIVFDRPSWFTIVLDIEGWDFWYKGAEKGFDQFIFFDEKPVPGQGNANARKKDPNHSFFNAKPNTVATGTGDIRNAVRCINYTKRPNDKGDDLGSDGVRECSRFGFNIYLHVPTARLAPAVVPESTKPVIVIIDPTGENQGPPPNFVPPPKPDGVA